MLTAEAVSLSFLSFSYRTSLRASQRIINQLVNPQNTVLPLANGGTFRQSSCIVYRRIDYRLAILHHVGVTSHVINPPSALKLTRCVSDFFAATTRHVTCRVMVILRPLTEITNARLVCYISNMCIRVCPPAATYPCMHRVFRTIGFALCRFLRCLRDWPPIGRDYRIVEENLRVSSASLVSWEITSRKLWNSRTESNHLRSSVASIFSISPEWTV